ncbi:MAG: hypothetical protein GC182_08505 [Rhodopseudomonas sp.]|nr:hypothetical protein [Rhodopseudomonas sp.]
MVDVRLTEVCGEDEAPLFWDSVWDPLKGFADWQVAAADEAGNVGGLRAKAMLATAVTLCLFTDKRVEPTHPLFWLCDGDPRGWWGDGVDVRDDLGETEMGSLLWLLARAPMTINGIPVERWAEQFAREALQPLLDQGAVVRMDVAATADTAAGRLYLTVNLFGRDGQAVYAQRLALVWKQITG